VAFAAADIRGNGSGCIIWTDNLIDLRYVDGGQLLYLRLPKSELGMRTSTITLYILVHLHRDAILLSFQDFNIEVYSTLPLSQIFVCFDIGCRTRGTLTRAIGNRETLVASYYCSGIRHGFYSRTGLTICYRGVGLVEHMGHYIFFFLRNIWDIICMTWVPQPLIPSLFFPYVLIKFMQIEVQTTPSCLMKRAFCQLGPAAQHNWATAVAQATQTPPFIDPATVKRATRHFSRKKYDW
jgi:hypothetical protein